MLRSFFYLILFTGIAFGLTAQKVSHQTWTELLQKHVDPYGIVDYKGFKDDEAKLDVYLDRLNQNPAMPYWKVEEQEAYWINAYNAFTIKLILDY